MSSPSKPTLVIDGRQGEGGGQVLRTALALSLCTQTPFRIEHIRAKRKKPGLLAQHLTCVRAAAQIGDAALSGAELGSEQLEFSPQALRGGHYQFDIGTAGSTTLVLQAVLPALALAAQPSELHLRGGTHNPAAPTFDFLANTLLPVLRRFGPNIRAELDAHGFYPGGGGAMRVFVEPTKAYQAVELLDRGVDHDIEAHILLAELPDNLAQRQINLLRSALGVDARLERISGRGQAHLLRLSARSDALCETFTAFGDPRLRVEAITRGAIDLAQEYLRSDAVVGPHLADQLIVFMALSGEGRFRTLFPTPHTKTAIEVIRQFLGSAPSIRKDGRTWIVEALSGTPPDALA